MDMECGFLIIHTTTMVAFPYSPCCPSNTFSGERAYLSKETDRIFRKHVRRSRVILVLSHVHLTHICSFSKREMPYYYMMFTVICQNYSALLVGE